MDTKDLSSKLAVVTGSGSGIGQAIALACAKRGAALALCDVDEKGLEGTASAARDLGAKVITMRVDVASREQMQAFATLVHQELGPAALLFNNAGVGLGAGFLDTTLDDWRWIVDINLMGVVHGSHFFVPEMVRVRSGHVVNVASSAAFAPSQTLTAYATTKAAVVGLSEAMRNELKEFGIGVTAICPGVINTPIARSTKRRGWQDVSNSVDESVKLFAKRNYSPERAAEAMLEAVGKNRGVAPIAPEAWALYYTRRVAPTLLEWLDDQLVAQGKKRSRR